MRSIALLLASALWARGLPGADVKLEAIERPDFCVILAESPQPFLAEVARAGTYVLGRDAEFYYLALPSPDRVVPEGAGWRFWPWERMMLIRVAKLTDAEVTAALDRQPYWDDLYQLPAHPELNAFVEGRTFTRIRKSPGSTAGPRSGGGSER